MAIFNTSLALFSLLLLQQVNQISSLFLPFSVMPFAGFARNHRHRHGLDQRQHKLVGEPEIIKEISTTESPLSELTSFITNPLVLLYLSENLDKNRNECFRLYTYLTYRMHSTVTYFMPPFPSQLSILGDILKQRLENYTEYKIFADAKSKYACFELLKKWDRDLLKKDVEGLIKSESPVSRTHFATHLLINGLNYINRWDLSDWLGSTTRKIEDAKLGFTQKIEEIKKLSKRKNKHGSCNMTSVTLFVYFILGLTVILLAVALFYMAQKGYFNRRTDNNNNH